MPKLVCGRPLVAHRLQHLGEIWLSLSHCDHQGRTEAKIGHVSTCRLNPLNEIRARNPSTKNLEETVHFVVLKILEMFQRFLDGVRLSPSFLDRAVLSLVLGDGCPGEAGRSAGDPIHWFAARFTCMQFGKRCCDGRRRAPS